MYVVVAPGFASICKTWSEVERIKKIYFYPKFAKVNSEEEAQQFIKRNTMTHFVTSVYNYGNVLDALHVKVHYRIAENCIYAKVDTSKIGAVKFMCHDELVEYHGDFTYIRINNIHLSDETIASHLSAICNILAFLGDWLDVQLYLPNFSIYYALTGYTGSRLQAAKFTRDFIKRRKGNVSYSLEGINVE